MFFSTIVFFGFAFRPVLTRCINWDASFFVGGFVSLFLLYGIYNGLRTHSHGLVMYIFIYHGINRMLLTNCFDIYQGKHYLQSNNNEELYKQPIRETKIWKIKFTSRYACIHTHTQSFLFNFDIWICMNMNRQWFRWNQMTCKQILIWVVCFVHNSHKRSGLLFFYLESARNKRACTTHEKNTSKVLLGMNSKGKQMKEESQRERGRTNKFTLFS